MISLHRCNQLTISASSPASASGAAAASVVEVVDVVVFLNINEVAFSASTDLVSWPKSTRKQHVTATRRVVGDGQREH